MLKATKSEDSSVKSKHVELLVGTACECLDDMSCMVLFKENFGIKWLN